ncbi:MAG: DUF1573 domain-containing protein [Bacteroidetes bacterium]|nr:DUF1573 domain-containing protein [Bacteroidota bacterium]
MKANLTLLFLFFCILSFGQNSFEVYPKSIDFGTIYFDTVNMNRNHYAGRSERKNIWVKNLGDTPLSIKTVKWGCNFCPTFHPRQPILPGDSGLVSFYIKVDGYERLMHKTITIVTTAGQETVTFGATLKYMPHFFETDSTHFSFPDINNRNRFMLGRDTIIMFSVRNISDEELILSDFKADALISIDTASIILPAGQSRTIYAEFKARIPPAHYRMTTVGPWINTYSKIYFFSSNGVYRELITIAVDVTITTER